MHWVLKILEQRLSSSRALWKFGDCIPGRWTSSSSLAALPGHIGFAMISCPGIPVGNHRFTSCHPSRHISWSFSLFLLHRLKTSLLLGLLYLWWCDWSSWMPGHKVTQLILLQAGAVLRPVAAAGRIWTCEAGTSSEYFHIFQASSCHLHWAKNSKKKPLVISYREKYIDSLLFLKCNIWRAERKEIAVCATFVLFLFVKGTGRPLTGAGGTTRCFRILLVLRWWIAELHMRSLSLSNAPLHY